MPGKHRIHVGAQEMVILFCFLGSSKGNSEVSFNRSGARKQIPARSKYFLLFNKYLNS